jgi:hypothetical protein
MYRDNNTRQGCVLVKVHRIPDKIKVDSEDLTKPLEMFLKSLYEIRVHTSIIENTITSHSSRMSAQLMTTTYREDKDLEVKCSGSSRLKVNCGIICSKSELDKVLRVSPDLIFLSKSNNFTEDVYIISNVVWNIN